MKLTAWIKVNGGTGATGALLGIQRNCVYAWLHLRVLPRPDMMERIVKFTKGTVTYAEMIEEYNAARAKTKKKGVGRGFNSPPSIMKRLIQSDVKRRKAAARKRKTVKRRAIVDPGF